MQKQFFVYILASKPHGTLYVGVTSTLARRVWQHKSKVIDGFTSKYGIDKLVHYEVFDSPQQAIQREKQLKRWKRQWKIDLVEETNPQWRDLYEDIGI